MRDLKTSWESFIRNASHGLDVGGPWGGQGRDTLAKADMVQNQCHVEKIKRHERKTSDAI
jgi:hypothetical protein